MCGAPGAHRLICGWNVLVFVRECCARRLRHIERHAERKMLHHEQSAKAVGIAGKPSALQLWYSTDAKSSALLRLLQRQVLSLYRTVLRTARTKGPEADPIVKFARAEFERCET